MNRRNLCKFLEAKQKIEQEEPEFEFVKRISFNVFTFRSTILSALHSEKGINLPKQIVEHHVEGITWRLAALALPGAKSETFFFLLCCANLAPIRQQQTHKELWIWLNLKRNNIANRNPQNLNQMKCVVILFFLLCLGPEWEATGGASDTWNCETCQSLSKICLIASSCDMKWLLCFFLLLLLRRIKDIFDSRQIDSREALRWNVG